MKLDELISLALAPVDDTVSEACEAIQKAVAEHDRTTVRYYGLIKQSGKEHAYEARLEPLEVGSIVFIRDVTENRRLQTQLSITERMASLGTLAAGVAHEINNPLTWIHGNIAILLSRVESGDMPTAEELREGLSEALDGTDRVARIVRELRSFTQVGDTQIGPVRLAEPIESAINLTANETRDKAVLVREYDKDLVAYGDSHQLVQVLVNVLVNAAQAFVANGGDNTISIQTSTRDEMAIIAIADNGPGMSRALCERVFDPFYTTKAGTGTGLGLAISKRILDAVGGDIALDSILGEGTVVSIALPTSPGSQLSTDSSVQEYQ